MIHHGDCLEVVAGMESESVDAIVTDPPYGLGFMGKEWDALPPGLPWAEQCLRVLKPGGHLLAFGGSRTFHRLAVAVEDAGFEIRDQLQWLYGSGFPKSLDVSKAIDKAAGAERKIVGREKTPFRVDNAADRGTSLTGSVNGDFSSQRDDDGYRYTEITAPATEDAATWEGWGTALKPAHEPIVLARKPLSGTVASTVLEHGTGALNIDGCRVGDGGNLQRPERRGKGSTGGWADYEQEPGAYGTPDGLGRWPANLVLDEQAGAMLDAQSGVQTSRASNRGLQYSGRHGGLAQGEAELKLGTDGMRGHSDTGGASRFFYSAKTSRAERNAGLDGFEEQRRSTQYGAMGKRRCNVCGTKSAAPGAGGRWPNCEHDDWQWAKQEETGIKGGNAKNHHPTVKPIDLMRWLVRLVTPPGGIVLDPFTGSGSTGIAAHLEGMEFIGIEREAEYLAIAEARIAWWGDKHGDTADILVANGLAEKAKAEHVERGQLDLLGEAA